MCSLHTKVVDSIQRHIDLLYQNLSQTSHVERRIFDTVAKQLEEDVLKHFNKKPRQKKTIDTLIQCIAMKADGHRCTRRRKAGTTFCASHHKNHENGVIQDESLIAAMHKADQNTEKKTKEESKDAENKIACHIEEISGTLYLVDTDMNVYTYDVENPVFIGKLNGKKIDYAKGCEDY